MDDCTAAKLNAVALSIAQSICRVIASSSLDRFETECLQLMGAEDCDGLVLSLQATLLTVLESSASNANMQTCKPPAHLDLVRRKIEEGEFVEAYSRLDKFLDGMASALAGGQGFSI